MDFFEICRKVVIERGRKMPDDQCPMLLAMLPPQVWSVQKALETLGLDTVCASDLNGVRDRLVAHPRPRLVLTQIGLWDGNWRDVLAEVSRVDARIPVILYTPVSAGTELWMDALDSGIYDLIHSENDGAALKRIILEALTDKRTEHIEDG